MDLTNIKMGNLAPSWEAGSSQTVTLCVTEACDLRCRYCYMTGKNNRNRMTIEVGKKAVDFVLSDQKNFKDKTSIVWDFIGGEPFLEIDMIDELCDYIKKQMYIKNHRWFNRYRFSFSTNGLTYDTPKVQNFLKKNIYHVSVGISVDGNKIKHDAQRVHADGTGSFEEVRRVIPLWLEQFPESNTKATFAHDDLIYLKDSIISLWNMGIKEIAANIVFEDVWKEGDEVEFENQLKELADYVIDNNMWNEYSVRFFDKSIGLPLTEDLKRSNYCGAGKMMAIDYKGDIYPCIRFTPFTLNNTDGYKIGNIYDGINYDLLRPFVNLTTLSQSKNECLDCDVATGCAWCSGYNFDEISGETLFYRSTNICEMHKANVKGTNYFWDKLSKRLNIENPRHKLLRESKLKRKWGENIKYMQIMTSDNIVPHCCYENKGKKNRTIEHAIYEKALKFCKENYFIPVIMEGRLSIDKPADCLSIGVNDSNSIVVHDEYVEKNVSCNNVILITKDCVNDLYCFLDKLINNEVVVRVNIIIKDMAKWDQEIIKIYEKQLRQISECVYKYYKNGRKIEVNVLTDIFNYKSVMDCGSGIISFTIAPNGKVYICPAFYFDNEDDNIGDLDKGINIKHETLLHIEKSYICSSCDAYHCKRCLFLNKKMTKQINTPPEIQCVISHVERNISRELEIKLIKEDLIDPINFVNKIDYNDPVVKLTRKRGDYSVSN